MAERAEEQGLYLKDSYLREFEAVVKEVNQDKYIVLDRTAFYPNSGGQPHDTGTMEVEASGTVYKVVYVGKFGGNISHEVEASADQPRLKPGDRVKCRIDWERRYKLMRMHTAAHIISQVIHQDTGAMITGNQLDVDRSRIDFSVDEFDREKLKGYEDKSNEIVNKKIQITSDFMKREDVINDPGMTKLAKGLPEEVKIFRILRIGDFDMQADGGTHVKNTKEVGRISFVDFVNKGKNNRRVYFKLV